MSVKHPFEEFAKIDFRVGKIIQAEQVPGAKKLVKLKIDIGGTVKQSVAGLGGHYKPEDLVSKQVVVVTNLQPKKMFGLDSEVMLLAAVDGDTVCILKPDRDMALGSKVT
ncbi:MAG: methionine--tRNA ligase subunit beta [Thaumarchaeota archaeon]|nr:methionine--tRNA ligase subunit beta [Nitrososphaerota archaeon]